MKTLVILLSILFLTSLNFAQLSGNINYGLAYDDNPLRYSDGSEEFLNEYSSDLLYQPFGQKLYLTYSGSMNAFKNISDRNYQLHTFGLFYDFNLSKADDSSDETSTSAGISYSMKSGSGDYSILNFSLLQGFANYKYYIFEDLTLHTGYTFRRKEFPSISDLTQTENLLWTRASKYFESKTGLFFEAGIGNKNYSVQNEIAASTTGYMQGKGKGQHSLMTQDVISFNALQVRTSLRLSQSVFQNTGIAAYFTNRINLTKVGRGFSTADLFYADDDDLWDDPYAYNGNQAGLQLTQMLPYNIILKATYEYSLRDYTANAADSASSMERNDIRREVWAGLSKTISTDWLISSIDLHLQFMFINNSSNEAFFNYKNNMMQFGISLGF